MRVLVTATGSPSHVHAMLPLINALTAARHRVLVALPPPLLGAVNDLPVETAPVLPDPFVGRPEFTGSADVPALQIFAAPHVSLGYRQLLPVTREFGADLVLRDGAEFAGLLVAEALGVPCLGAPSGSTNVLDPAELQPVLDQRRAEVDLPPVADPAAVHRYGRLEGMPAQYPFTTWAGSESVHRYQQPVALRPGGALPDWLAELPGEQPLVLATLGTVLPGSAFDTSAVLRTVVAAVAETDCQAVVATGGHHPGATETPPRVHLVDRIDQPLLLRCAQLLITHGGYNSIREAVGAGVPMAVLPFIGDQHGNAARVQAHGLGRHLPEPVTSAELAAAITELLADLAVTARVRQAQRRMLALPPVEAVVGLLEKLAQPGGSR
ncbi:glycosyltransferase [Kitasatospora sp. RB6PN24]|uniref:glycosyltransferase n=1 Tax=Kitasatospora humi TaxID=2893891 RepID=UPI001E52128D|nr:glycosyltransferase [Kitasatospora humi]MCC9308348.1 glycosyltransferase [Kitasatospora humi]